MTRSQHPTKIETVRQMLSAPEGASIGQICATTGWQAHSARAALSGLRKAGLMIIREAADEAGNGSVYRTLSTRDAAEDVQ